MSRPWLVSWPAGPARPARPTLLCLPQAGAGCGQFRPWQDALGPEVSVVGVQLPGRENRFTDPPARSVGEVVGAVVAEIAGDPAGPLASGLPLVVFGNSFGGLLGYEVARALGGRHGRWPDALVVAACRPPGMWTGAGRGLVEGEEELERLLAGRGLGEDDLDEDSRELALEVLRHDARLSLTYIHDDGAGGALCPVEAWGGEADETVTPGQLAGWRDHAAAGFHRRLFPGGHHFCLERPGAVLPLLRELLREPARTPERSPR
ncbi:thioesterase II family protein [Planomonospora parontospora]|uniref:thioesterase II family protein n=1 Tax=Planomonospora parontospora TaxID=58119 RepID=UPI0019426615|nr:thioesterase [Planomonospora parontospora]GGL14174.1 thioesterase [Planomonospora parontospora subsp. antibiotica]GII17866.1 thioesterase [Planomonospora parontospora subsp. antibiotica]